MVSQSLQLTTPFGRRLRALRLRADMPQDKLGVMIGLDEGCSSSRISRYENGIHEPPFMVAEQLANVFGVSASYFYCSDDALAEIILQYANYTANERKICQLSLPNAS